MAPNRDNSLRGAQNLGLSPQRRLNNRLQGSDSEDLFRFQIQQPSQFSASLSKTSPRSRLSLQLVQVQHSLNQLLQQTGNQAFSQLKPNQRHQLQLLQRSQSPSGQPITQVLAPGSYFLRVARQSGQSRYQLVTDTVQATDERTSVPASLALPHAGLNAPIVAAVDAPRLTRHNQSSYRFSVTYHDDRALDIHSIDSNDILVTGPNGFQQQATLVSHEATGSNDTATYQITASQGSWAAVNNGTYQLQLQPNQVSDIDGIFAGTGLVGSFQIEITNPYSNLFGYGLVNASAAVARVLEQAPFADVTNSLNSQKKALDQINAPEVWAKGYRGQSVIVAILDTGVDYTNHFLSDSLWNNPGEIACDKIDNDQNGYIDDTMGWNFVSDSNDIQDDHLEGHGTFVAGIITDQDFGIAPDAQVMLVKTADADGFVVSDDRLAEGIYYAVQNGAKIINLSFGGPTPPNVNLQQAFQFAHERGVLLIAAAGNERQSGAVQPLNPALYTAQNSLGFAAGAVDSANRLADFSNPAGQQPLNYLVAPGVKLYSTAVNSSSPAEGSGTSFASPMIAGVAALMLSANPNLTPDQIQQILIETANPDLVA